MAGVSPTSVSNVINGKDSEMRPDTKARILLAVKELKYIPNLAARQLKTGHASAIGIMAPSISYPFFGNLVRLVEEFAASHGYHVLITNSDRNPETERQIAEELWGYGVRGLIVGSSLPHLTHFESLIDRGLHIIAFDRATQEHDRVAIDSVGVDNIQVSRLLCKHLLGLGHKRIGFISGPIQLISRMERLQGYRMTLKENGIETDPDIIWIGAAKNYGDTSAIELGRQAAHDLLSKPNPPTALMAVNYHYAFGLYAGARDLGFQIPRDVSITAVDDPLVGDVINPAMTVVRQPLAKIAKLLIERLIGRMNGSCGEPPSDQFLNPQLVVRASTAKAGEVMHTGNPPD